MKTERPPAEQEEQFNLPANLTEWADPSTVTRWVEEEVGNLDWDNPEVTGYLQHHPDYQPKRLMSLLCYAYATEVFGSDEIVRLCYEDAIYRGLCQGRAPQKRELIRFRRENRGLLRGVLAYVFIRAVRERFDLGTTLIPPGLKRLLLDNAVERLDTARHLDSMEE
jgi:hypothetical protein